MSDDATLLRRFVATRANTEFEALVRRHLDAVYSAALRRVGGDIHLAEDVTQQTFVALARRAPALVGHPSLGAWLHRVTRNLAANTVRAELRRKVRENAALNMEEISKNTSTSSSVHWLQVAPLIDQAIDGLSESDRAAVVLRFFENRAYSEIGRTLRLSEDAARMRVDRALDKLRSALAHRGVTSTSAALGLALSHHAIAAAPTSLTAAAISSAAAGSGARGVFGIFHAMTATKLVGSTALVVLVAFSIGSASHALTRERSLTAVLEAAKSADATSARRLRELEDQLAAAEQRVETTRQELDRAEKQKADATRRAAAKAERMAKWNPSAEGKAFMERHPEVRQALNDWVDGCNNFQWSGLYEQLGMNAAQIAEFQKLRREGFGYGGSVEPNSPPMFFKTGDGTSWTEIEDRIRQMLGDDGYHKYQSYFPAIPGREFAAQVASALTFTDQPLSTAQVSQLSDRLTTEQAVTFGRSGKEFDWNKITSATQAILSPEQCNAVNAIRAQAELDKAYNEAASAQAKQNPGP
jgi:RNA polymerase sigma factor (sigma-70 family)